MQSPLIDKRDYAELVAETTQLAQKFSGWRPRSDGQTDAGQALIRIFGHFAELVVQRINRAPEKNYLAFLNLLGTQPLPPRPARVPLTFRLADNSPVDGVVPAGAQVAAPALEGEEDEVIFETERNLTVTRAQLQAVFVRDSEGDTYSDHTAAANGLIDQPFAVFTGDHPTAHELYVACDPLLTGAGAKDVTLVLQSPDTWQWNNWPITWAYWDGANWRELQPTSATVSGGAWRVTLAGLPPLPLSPVNGIAAGWLRARLKLPLPPGEAAIRPDALAIGNRNPQELITPVSPYSDSAVRRFYLSVDEAFAAGGALVRLHIALAQAGVGAAVQLNWFYKVGEQWLALGQSSTSAPQVGASEFSLRDTTQALTRDGEVSFHAPLNWPRELYRTRTGRWLRVDIVGDGQYTTLPQIKALTVSYDWELPRLTGIRLQLNQALAAQPAEAAFWNSSALDLSKDFYPLGEQPRFNDTLYLAYPATLAQPGKQLKLTLTLTNPAGTTSPPAVYREGNPQIAWEVWDGRTWQVVTAVGPLTPTEDTEPKRFLKGGTVTITLPATLAPTAVNGEERYWLRARLIGGHYGVAATYSTGTDKSGNTIYLPVAATFAPPVIKILTLELVGAQQPEAPPSACLSHNDFDYVDLTGAATAPGALFLPFTPTADSDPALYLGFDQAFAPRPVTLYLQVEPPRPEEVAADRLAEIDPATLAQITWEYASPDGWQLLGAVDETQTLSSRGLVQFVGPKNFVARACFGQPLYWVRARWPRGFFPLPPRLRRVLLNTTWAAQLITSANQILGSSNGNPNQSFQTAQTPIQPGQQVMVRERELPPLAEQQALLAEEGTTAITVTQDAAGQPDEIWVRWHPVPDFYHSRARDRHYTVDPLSGEIRFGDGQTGLIPPQGQNNIRITYRTGGGAQGNRAQQTIVQLKSGIPYIDEVTNHETANGGAAREPLARLKVRGPRVLRHRDRAVTAEDLEDLALAASPEVARAAAIVPTFDPFNLWLDPTAPSPTPDHSATAAGRCGVIVVPTSAVGRPTPSLSLLRQVQNYLQARCPATTALWVAGPEWIAVTVRVTLAPTTIETADATADRVRTALEHFLHPLTGGPHGQGWAFGRKPHRSDLFALVEAVAGVDHVRTLAVSHEPESTDSSHRLALQRILARPLQETGDQTGAEQALYQWLARALVYSGPHEITIAL